MTNPPCLRVLKLTQPETANGIRVCSENTTSKTTQPIYPMRILTTATLQQHDMPWKTEASTRTKLSLAELSIANSRCATHSLRFFLLTIMDKTLCTVPPTNPTHTGRTFIQSEMIMAIRCTQSVGNILTKSLRARFTMKACWKSQICWWPEAARNLSNLLSDH